LKAYKAVVLLLLDNGKDEEASLLVDKIRKSSPTDKRLIETLTQALDLLGRGIAYSMLLIEDGETTMLYEEASKKNPKDEEFGRHWFLQMILRDDIDGSRKVYPLIL
jgi:N-terminal acetyltransferase B complex non-catalytic subunit